MNYSTTKSALGQGLCLTYGHLFNEYGCCKDCGAPDPAKVHAFVPGRESGIAEGARMCAVCDYLPGVGRHG